MAGERGARRAALSSCTTWRDDRDGAGRHAELGEAEADQQADQRRIGRHLAAQRHRNALARRGAADQPDQPEHGGMQRLVEIRHAIVGAIDGQACTGSDRWCRS